MMVPAQIPMGTSTLLIGALVFVAILGAMLYYALVIANPRGAEPWDDFVDACHKIVDKENADAIAFMAYSDGPMVPKPAIYDRELMGGKGGYRTPDGERIYMDGQGNGKYSLEGVDVIMAIDPTEHAAGADMLKAWIAHINDIGQWIKVDREGNLIESGEAIKALDDEITPAMDTPIGEGVATDGGYVSEVHKKALEDEMSLEDAKASLEQAGLLNKIVDIGPPREGVIDEETGEVRVEEASHVAVDVSAAANLLPKKTNTTAWQVVEERAKQEGRDEDKLMEYMMYGIVIGAVVAGVMALLTALVLGFT